MVVARLVHASGNQKTFKDQAHVDHIVDGMMHGTSVQDTLLTTGRHCKANIEPTIKPGLERLNQPISVPTSALRQTGYAPRDALEQTDLFTPDAKFNWQLVDKAGHFTSQQPDIVNAGIADWLIQSL